MTYNVCLRYVHASQKGRVYRKEEISMNDKTMESITSFIEKKLDSAVANSVVSLIKGRLSEKADLMYLAPNDSGMLRLVVHDWSGKITSTDMKEPALVIDPMQLVVELKDSIAGNCGEPGAEITDKYRATIARMREACDAMESMLGRDD